MIVNLALFIFLTTTFSSSAIKNASYNCEQTSVINYNYKDYKKVTFLNIEVDNKKKWYENSIGAILSKSNNGEAIDTKYKKRFKAKIIVHFGKNKICNFRGSIRLHGDYKDHLKFESGKLVSSLDVTIKNGHINSIRKFKLYLPESRKGINEVLITQLFKELKILSPNTFFLNTNVNNQKSLYLFQEKISKEMLEKNARREGPIFETIDENKKSNFIFTRLHLAKLVNKEWLTKGFNNFFYTFKNFNRINRALLSSNKKFDRKFYIEHEYLNQNLDKFRVFEPILYSLGYPHGLSKNNRYFYLNIVSGEFEPIYYDGDIAKIKNFKYDKKNFNSKIVTPFIFENSIYALNQLKKINPKKFYKKNLAKFIYLSEDDIVNFFLDIEYNLNFLSNLRINKKREKEPLPDNIFSKINKSEKIVFLSQEKSKIHICDKFFDCNIKKVNKELLMDLIAGTANINDQTYYLVSVLDQKIENFDLNQLNKNFSNMFKKKNDELRTISIDNFIINISGQITFEIDNSKKTISFFQNSIKDRVIFEGENIKDWTIKFTGTNNSEKKDFITKVGNRLLTGCLTFNNIKIENINIKIENSGCEDALNIINSFGEINDIEINNSISDALDLDFSKIKINELNVNFALNDCADFSGGIYHIINLNLINCSDKAISVGEKSYFKMNNGKILKSNFGVVSKDSSTSLIENININNTNICFSGYNKKSEFSGGFIKVKKFKCSNYLLMEEKDKFSKIEYKKTKL